MAHGPDEIDRLLGADGDLAHDEVARLFATMRTAAQPSELSDVPQVVATLAHEIAQSPTPLRSRRKPVLAKALTTKVAVTAAVVLMGSSAAVAATNGSLPDPAQSAVSNALSHAGVSVPDGHDAHPDTPRDAGATKAKGPDVAGPAKFGLCEAVAAGSETGRSHKANAIAFTNLQHAAAAEHQTVAEFCKDALPAGGTPTTTHRHGPPEDRPNHGAGKPDETPNAGRDARP